MHREIDRTNHKTYGFVVHNRTNGSGRILNRPHSYRNSRTETERARLQSALRRPNIPHRPFEKALGFGVGLLSEDVGNALVFDIAVVSDSAEKSVRETVIRKRKVTLKIFGDGRHVCGHICLRTGFVGSDHDMERDLVTWLELLSRVGLSQGRSQEREEYKKRKC